MDIKISRSVTTRTKVVNLPIFFDFVQPDSEIITANENSLTKKVNIPITLGRKKSSGKTSFK